MLGVFSPALEEKATVAESSSGETSSRYEKSLQTQLLFTVAKGRIKFPANSGFPLKANTVVPSWFLNKSYFGLLCNTSYTIFSSKRQQNALQCE